MCDLHTFLDTILWICNIIILRQTRQNLIPHHILIILTKFYFTLLDVSLCIFCPYIGTIVLLHDIIFIQPQTFLHVTLSIVCFHIDMLTEHQTIRAVQADIKWILRCSCSARSHIITIIISVIRMFQIDLCHCTSPCRIIDSGTNDHALSL